MRQGYATPLLGPCRCQGCGDLVWWARRMSRYLGNLRPKTAWRDEDGTLHRCPNWEHAVAAKGAA